MKLKSLFSKYRWPLYLGGLLGMSIIAQGVLVYVATRPDAPRPVKDYYQRSLAWDVDQAVEDASRQLGWTVRYEVPSGPQYTPGMPRPVDVHVRDADGAPVTGLAGSVFAARPADGRMDRSGELTALPHAPGRYRTLLPFARGGLWELRLDARADRMRFVHRARVTITQAGAATAARERR
jgi:nitrogen fixation protein FixH